MTGSAAWRSTVGHLRTPLYLNAYSLIVSNGLTSVLGLLFWATAARLYTVEAVGLSSAALSTAIFVSGIGQLNLRVTLLRLVPETGPATGRLVRRAYLAALGATAALGIGVFGILAMIGAPWGTLAGLSTPAGVALLVVGAMCLSIYNLQDGVLAGLRRTPWVPLENGTAAVARIIVLAALAGSLPALGIVTSWLLPVLAAAVGVTIVLAWRWIPVHEADGAGRAISMDRRRVLSFVAADTVGAWFALGSSTLLPVLVVVAAGPREGAWFAMAWAVVTALTTFPTNMAASMTVETVHARTELAAEVRRLARHMTRLTLPMLLAVQLLAPWILRLFGPDYAAGATDVLRIASLGLVPLSVNVVAVAMARVRGQGRDILVIQAAIAVLTLALAAVLLPAIGLTGVAVAWLGAQSVVAVIALVHWILPAVRSSPA